MAARALRVVDMTDEREELPKGDPSLTEEAVASWSAGQRRCRGRRRHNWNPAMVYEHRDHYEVIEQCSHCRNRRHAEFFKTARGLRKEGPWKLDYRDGYVLPKGAMRIDDDIQDELVAADILSRRVVEVTDEEDK